MLALPPESGQPPGRPASDTPDATAAADCRISRALPVGDHTLDLGRVLRIRRYREHPPTPLLYGLRRYGSWAAAELPDEALR
ncbi:flavin reductase [Kitasatospora sp. NPDC059599]|uniref:flavin reductase n=1 Tax=Kitasatospora sp. NPDC059599 TaxID=3346880 RepID=UPI0036A8F38D